MSTQSNNPVPHGLSDARVNRAARAMYKQLRKSQGMADLWRDLTPETRFAWREAFIAGIYGYGHGDFIDDAEA